MSAVAVPSTLTTSRAMLSFFDSLVVARRNLTQIVRIPAVLVFELVQPVMFVLLFVYVFGGNIILPEGFSTYTMYLMPGIIIQNAIFGSTTTAIGIAEDLKSGLVDRFRSLPMARSAMLAGRATSDLVKNFILLLVVIGIGYLVGFSFEEGFLNALAMIVLVMAVSFTFSWVMAAIALWVKKLEAVQAAAFTGIFPLVFMSSALVPIAGDGGVGAGDRPEQPDLALGQPGTRLHGRAVPDERRLHRGTHPDLLRVDHRSPRGLHAALDPAVLEADVGNRPGAPGRCHLG